MSERVLCVGIVVVDIITEVPSFPKEDIKTRCGQIYEKVGGNGASNSRVLSVLGEDVSFMGCVGTSGQHYQVVQEFFQRYKVDTTPVVKCEGHPMPLTNCILNMATGSRTCLHYRGSLPELSFDMFKNAGVVFSSFKWIHFEARYEAEDALSQIEYLHSLRTTNGYSYTISVELEKACEPLAPLLHSHADYAFVSKDYSMLMGHSDMNAAAEGLTDSARNGMVIICPWGSSGAAAKVKGQQVVTSPAHPPAELVNTLGAGDTFIAACIKALMHDLDLQRSLTYACRVAGAKCGLKDLDELKNMDLKL